MGRSFDPVLADLCERVRRWRAAPRTRDTYLFCVDRLALATCVFGHLLAAATDDASTVPDEQMRRFITGGDSEPEASLNLFYWIHPHPEVSVMRSAAAPSVRGRLGSAPMIFSLLKVPPLAFMVSSASGYEGLPTVLPSSAPGASRAALPLWSELERDPDWPERVDPGNFIFVGAPARDAFTARPLPGQRLR